jgi:adenine-specific DNA-methyltransferase
MTIDSNSPEKLCLASLDIAATNQAKLKELFPSVFVESFNDRGELVESIDFEKLKAELGKFSEVFENRREHYGMDWAGKKDALKLVQKQSLATLKPCREESVNFDTTGNLFIEGDNLEVLKLLQKSYYGKVKMIYIDPPYNTGKEFIYPDDYSETLENYLVYAGLVDDEGKRLSTNTSNEGRFHTQWMNMMYPRLYLARNLLREDGVIFISIDDREVKNLRSLCDEIFGEDNFVATIVWQKKYAATNDAKGFSTTHDYIVVYQKSIKFERYLLPRTEEQNKLYKNDDGDGLGLWRSDNLLVKSFSKSGVFSIKNPNTGEEFWPPQGSCWRANQETISQWLKENRIFFGKDGKGAPQLKRYLNEVQQGRVPITWWSFQEAGHNDAANKELSKLFNAKAPFDTPKPSQLIIQMLQIATQEQDLVLDFFAGSCTTAHAVLAINKKDGGDRKFITIQIPEHCAENSEAFKLGYKTIADIGKERIRRVILTIIQNEQECQKIKNQLPEIRKEVSQLDLGFKVFKLDKSTFKVWDGSNSEISEEELVEQLENFSDRIDPKATQEDILYELLLKAGFMPTEKVEKQEMAGKTVFSIADSTLLICLEDELTRELIDAVAEAQPVQFICLDRGFQGNDRLKINTVQIFNSHNHEGDKMQQIVFLTV